MGPRTVRASGPHVLDTRPPLRLPSSSTSSSSSSSSSVSPFRLPLHRVPHIPVADLAQPRGEQQSLAEASGLHPERTANANLSRQSGAPMLGPSRRPLLRAAMRVAMAFLWAQQWEDDGQARGPSRQTRFPVGSVADASSADAAARGRRRPVLDMHGMQRLCEHFVQCFGSPVCAAKVAWRADVELRA
eukprot:1732989-Pyramimonas_sp.AAC.4